MIKPLNIERKICMEMNGFSIIITVINFILLFAIIIVIYKAIQGFKNFVNRNKEMDKKIDVILNKSENKEDN
jgi:F0F1-type ATP synthase membrane subunit b/b'